MHELGIVAHVIKQIEKIAEENKVNKVVELTLEVGEVSGVIKEYFVDAFNWSIKKISLFLVMMMQVDKKPAWMNPLIIRIASKMLIRH